MDEIIFEITKRMDDIDIKIMKLINLKSKSKLIKDLIKNLAIEIEILDERIDIIEQLVKS